MGLSLGRVRHSGLLTAWSLSSYLTDRSVITRSRSRPRHWTHGERHEVASSHPSQPEVESPPHVRRRRASVARRRAAAPERRERVSGGRARTRAALAATQGGAPRRTAG